MSAHHLASGRRAEKSRLSRSGAGGAVTSGVVVRGARGPFETPRIPSSRISRAARLVPIRMSSSIRSRLRIRGAPYVPGCAHTAPGSARTAAHPRVAAAPALRAACARRSSPAASPSAPRPAGRQRGAPAPRRSAGRLSQPVGLPGEIQRQTLPNTLVATVAFNEQNSPTSFTYSKRQQGPPIPVHGGPGRVRIRTPAKMSNPAPTPIIAKRRLSNGNWVLRPTRNRTLARMTVTRTYSSPVSAAS